MVLLAMLMGPSVVEYQQTKQTSPALLVLSPWDLQPHRSGVFSTS